MADRQLTTVAVLAGVACCIAAPAAAVVLGGVALGSLGRFGVVSVSALVLVVGGAWMIDGRRARRSAEDNIPLAEEIPTNGRHV